MLNDNRVVHPFAWGVEFADEHANGVDPRKFFSSLSDQTVADSDEFFSLPEISDLKFEIADTGPHSLTWTSAIETPSAENNTARAAFFPYEANKRGAVIILPHWNAREGAYFDLCRILNRFGLSALRLTMPYHEERMPPELERAEYLVYPNVGRTLQSVQQAVLDTRTVVKWLKDRGYEKVGIVGTSIGSCTAFLAFVHDAGIDAGVFNHVSGYFSDVVWNGLSTYHVRESLEKEVSLEELREYWLPISPMAYMDKLAAQKPRPQRYIYTKYDLTFPYELSVDTMRALRERSIPHVETVLPCGHYTLGEKPWNYIDGYKIVSFLRKNLRSYRTGEDPS